MLVIGRQIREYREKLGWSVTKLATLAGISQSFLWRVENKGQTISNETLDKIAGAFGIPWQKLIIGMGNVEHAQIGSRKVPVLTYEQAALWTSDGFRVKDEEMSDFILTDLEHPPSIFAMRLRGDSMEPEFHEGDIVVIAPTVSPMPGDFVVATEEGGSTMFKQYRSAGINEHGQAVFELLPLNMFYAPMRSDRQKIAIVGTMIEHRRYRKR